LASGGIAPLLAIWGRTRGNIGVKGVAAINSMPLYLKCLPREEDGSLQNRNF